MVDGFFNILLKVISFFTGLIPSITIGNTTLTPSYTKTGAALAGLFGVFADKIEPLTNQITTQITEWFMRLIEQIGLGDLAAKLGL
jgi:hypothetical protein